MFNLPKERLIAYLFLLTNTALWGFAGPIIKFSLNYVSPSVFLLFRYVIATLIFLPVYILHLQKGPKHFNFKLIFILALLGTPLTLLPLFYGLQLTNSIEASIIVSTSPMLTILGGVIFLKEVMKPREWFGFSLAILGTILLIIDPILNSSSQVGGVSLLGNLLIFSSNVVWTTFLLLSKKFKVDPITLTFFSFLFSIPFMFIFSLFTNSTITLSSMALPGIVYMAIAGSIIAFWAYQEGQKRIEASEAAMFTYLQPIFALPLALLWLHEPMSPLSVFSLIIILFGVFVV